MSLLATYAHKTRICRNFSLEGYSAMLVLEQ
jgi:hypothetical protein